MIPVYDENCFIFNGPNGVSSLYSPVPGSSRWQVEVKNPHNVKAHHQNCEYKQHAPGGCLRITETDPRFKCQHVDADSQLWKVRKADGFILSSV